MITHRSSLPLVLLLATACSGAGAPADSDPDAGATDAMPDATPPGAAVLPLPTGAYHVARGERRTVIDASRNAAGAPQPDGTSRALSIELWYPTDDEATDDLAPYLDDLEGPTAKIAPAPMWWRAIRTHTHRHAAFAHDGGRRPVLLFSPGFTVMPRMYTAMLEELVSHGYVVVAISHPQWTTQTVFADGSTVAGRWDPSVLDDPARAAADAEVWTRDATAVLDEVEQIDADDPLHEVGSRLDLAAIAMIGHSFGGSTANNMGLVEARIRASVNLDGSIYGAARTTGGATPVLLFSADRQPDPAWSATYGQSTGPAYWLTLGDSLHFNFSDYGIDLAGWGLVDPTRLGTVDPGRALVVVDRFVLAFLDRYLAGTPSPLLAGLSADYPEIIGFQKRLAP